MVRLISIAASLLALFASAEACVGYYQCKYSDGAHCCVTRSRDGPGSCPDYCNGGVDWPPECISSITGHKRHPCF
ncbi:hypothetical protein ACJQWK_01631 [Exserohilum turcicum]